MGATLFVQPLDLVRKKPIKKINIVNLGKKPDAAVGNGRQTRVQILRPCTSFHCGQ